ncbi:MAG: radical SAM protein [Planctomycetota bacterium]|jgi:radical SAM protein with 4Fe4S-binding SPASM domain
MQNPRLIAFELTRRCRFNCPHCRADTDADKAEELTTDQCKKILDSIATLKGCTITFTGGEPMERSDIYELIRHSRKLKPILASCGYLINENSTAELKKAGVDALSFSMDGAYAKTHDTIRQADGAFEAVIRAAKTAKDASIRFQINTTISKLNIDEFVGIAHLADRLGAYSFNPFILVPTTRNRKSTNEIIDPVEYEALLNEMLVMKLNSDIQIRITCSPQFTRICSQQKLDHLNDNVPGCMGATDFAFITCKGDVQPCGFLDVSAGNLVDNGFDFQKIWQQSPLLNEIRDLSNYKDECGICEYTAFCGGCRARALVLTGDYLATDPVCKFIKHKS